MTRARLLLDNGMKIDLELYEDIAPITVKNFAQLAKDKFYDGLIFHRIIDRFMIQGGGYLLDGFHLKEKKAKSIKGEFESNGVHNPLKHEVGTISMARTNVKDSASSQFFICVNKTPHLDGEYAAFGKVVGKESINNILELGRVRTINIGYGLSDFPEEPIRIKTIIVEEKN